MKFQSFCCLVAAVGMNLLAAATPFGVRAAEIVIADPAAMQKSAVRHDFAGANEFKAESCPAGLCLRSTPHRSASALYQAVSIAGASLQRVRWSWRVDVLQPTADIRDRRTEDFGAVIMFVFGEPTWYHRNVPTLAYVWTSTPVPNGSLLRSTRFDSLRNVQLRGKHDAGLWQQEERDVAGDFKRAFGSEPSTLRYVVVFNDNDQTGEPTSAVFGPIRADR